MTDGCETAAIERAVAELGWGRVRIVVARRFWERLLGMGAPTARRGSGPPVVVAFPACCAVHTCFMTEPLDIAFIDAEGRVLAQHRAVEAWRFVHCRGAAAVLERRCRESCGAADAWLPSTCGNAVRCDEVPGPRKSFQDSS